jgi:hypothetical protein
MDATDFSNDSAFITKIATSLVLGRLKGTHTQPKIF